MLSRMMAPQRSMASAFTRTFKVMVCGGSGGIGQPMAMLMGLDERVTELVVMDVQQAMVPAAGVAADISHLERPCKVSSFSMDTSKPPVEQLQEALSGCDLVLIPAGVPRKPGMTRDDLFAINAGIAKGLVEACAKHCPQAVLGLIVNPVNSVVPAMATYYASQGLSTNKIVGVTTLDVVRSNKFVGEITGAAPQGVDVPVVGGHAGKTILPLLSQVTGSGPVPADKIVALDERIQDAGTEVVNAKGGKGSATLSMAYAGSRLGKAVLSGLEGKPTVEAAYVHLSDAQKAKVGTSLNFFATKVTFGKTGVEDVHPVGPMSAHEQTRFADVEKQLAAEIAKGLEFMGK